MIIIQIKTILMWSLSVKSFLKININCPGGFRIQIQIFSLQFGYRWFVKHIWQHSIHWNKLRYAFYTFKFSIIRNDEKGHYYLRSSVHWLAALYAIFIYMHVYCISYMYIYTIWLYYTDQYKFRNYHSHRQPTLYIQYTLYICIYLVFAALSLK